MHVLVTADTIGGVWTYAQELVTGLVSNGIRVTLVSFGEIPSAVQQEWMEGLPGLDFRPTAFRLEWMHEAQQDLPESSEYLASVAREVKPDLLHLNQYCYGNLPVAVPRIVVAHSDVVSWWASVHGEEPRDTEWLRWYRDVVSRGLAHANAVVAPSQWMLEAVIRFYNRPARSEVIYNGRNPLCFNPHMSKENSVLSVGRLWDGGKQVCLLTQHDHPVPVCIVGSERHPDTVFRGEVGLGRANPEFDFRGPQSEAQLQQLYARAAMYAATSKYEPFGLAPLEAALSRCAIIANDIPTFQEIWGDAAYFFRRNSSESLAYAIARHSSDPGLCRTYANLAYTRARERFTAGQMVENYMRLYGALATREAAVA